MNIKKIRGHSSSQSATFGFMPLPNEILQFFYKMKTSTSSPQLLLTMQ